MPAPDIVDTDALVADLRLAVAYAAKAGVLKDPALLSAIDVAEAALADPQRRDIRPVVEVLNNTVQAIHPMTLADLKFGRDPFLERNQRQARTLQLSLTVFTLLVLFFMGYCMQALKQEQEALAVVDQSQNLDPQQKLTALRKLAQLDKASNSTEAINEQYNQRKAELLQMNASLVGAFKTVHQAMEQPLLPMSSELSRFTERVGNSLLGSVAIAQTGPSAAEPPDSPAWACEVDADGQLRLPTSAAALLPWMQAAKREALLDYCFQINVLSQGGSESVGTGEGISRGTYEMPLRHKVSTRVSWFLPFLYGLLGSAVFMMRNISSVRTPAVGSFPVIMRICLGGVAGVAIGWFTSTESLSLPTPSVTLPFVLAFLTGYGIDLLFTLMDRLTRTLGAALSPEPAAAAQSAVSAPPRSLAT